MATISFKKGDEYALRLSRLGAASTEIAKKAIYEAAGIVADKIRDNLENVVSSEATGDLAKSLGITPISRDKDGNLNAKIGFDGYDRNGTANQLKANVLENGTSDQRQFPRPFVQPAVAATKKQALDAMRRVIDEETQKIMK
jgi:HK97 gp10 family phage protein